jgi:hypothetical protein
MKRFAAFLLMAGLLPGVFTLAPTVGAEETRMTEAHIERIKANCVEAQTQMSRIHTNDALLRVNRGQLYERLLTKLMSPFNSRVALNNLNGSPLVEIAATYEQQLMAFRTNYQQYEEAMSATLKINCINQPVAFYDSVADVRVRRSKVHQNTLQLQQSIQGYKGEFESFASTFTEGQQ